MMMPVAGARVHMILPHTDRDRPTWCDVYFVIVTMTRDPLHHHHSTSSTLFQTVDGAAQCGGGREVCETQQRPTTGLIVLAAATA